MKVEVGFIKVVLLVTLFSKSLFSFSQETDSTRLLFNFSGSVAVTTQGISTIPNLTLGKPASIFDLSMGRRLTFDPQLRFSLDGKPWTFLFWWRYKLLTASKLKCTIGVHPALVFKTRTFLADSIPVDKIVADRYLAGELNCNYSISEKISVGGYYLYSRGIEKNSTRNTHFISFRAGFSNLGLPGHLRVRFTPQIYYLILDTHTGYYFNATATLFRPDFPLLVSALVNKTIQSNIPVGKDFLWNVSLIYSFSRKFKEM